MTIDQEYLTKLLTRLKLTTVRDKLDSLLDEMARKELNLREALLFLCEQEVQNKDHKRVQMGISLSKFPYIRTLDQFDFAAQPSIDAGQFRELATCRWVANGDSLLLLGPPGVGKTHLAVALGREAIRQVPRVDTATLNTSCAPTIAVRAAGWQPRLDKKKVV